MRKSPIFAVRNSLGKVAGMAWLAGGSCEHHDSPSFVKMLGLDAGGRQTAPLPEPQVALDHVSSRSTFYGKTTLTVVDAKVKPFRRAHRFFVEEELELFSHYTYARHTIGAWASDSFGITSTQPDVQEFILHLAAALKAPSGGVRLEHLPDWLRAGFYLGVPALEDETSRSVLPGLVRGHLPAWFPMGTEPQRMAA